MPHLSDALAFPWLEGSRGFSIAFGTLTAGACLLLAVPILAWCLPGSRRWVFGKPSDPRQILQISYGVLCVSMAFADAFCRYIPHRSLGLVHPAFFLTTVALVVLLAPRIFALSLQRVARTVRPPGFPLGAVLGTLVIFPTSVVVQAFWF